MFSCNTHLPIFSPETPHQELSCLFDSLLPPRALNGQCSLPSSSDEDLMSALEPRPIGPNAILNSPEQQTNKLFLSSLRDMIRSELGMGGFDPIVDGAADKQQEETPCRKRPTANAPWTKQLCTHLDLPNTPETPAVIGASTKNEVRSMRVRCSQFPPLPHTVSEPELQQTQAMRSELFQLGSGGTIATEKSFRSSQLEQWKQRYQELLEFKDEYGHCLVPLNWATNPSLAHWVSLSSASDRNVYA